MCEDTPMERRILNDAGIIGYSYPKINKPIPLPHNIHKIHAITQNQPYTNIYKLKLKTSGREDKKYIYYIRLGKYFSQLWHNKDTT